MAAFQKFNQFVANLANGAVDLGSDALKVMLSNVTPQPTNAVYSDITEIAAGNGYVAGGNLLAIASSVQSGGVYVLLPAGTGLVAFNAAGGTIGPFRYAVLYDSLTLGLIGFYDYGSIVLLNPLDKFSVAFATVNGVLQIT